MKVAHVIIGLGVGGAESMLVKLVPGLARAGVESVVVSLTGDGPLAAPLRSRGAEVVDGGLRNAAGALPLLWRLKRLAPRLGADLVQGWMYHGNLAASLLARWAPGGPALAWNIRHSLADVRREKRLTRAIIGLGARWSDRPGAIIHNATVSVGQHTAVGFRADNAVMIPNGFDLERFRPDPSARTAQRREWGIPDDATVVAHLGRLHPMKGHAVLLEAVAGLLEADPGLHVVCVGRDVTADRLRVAAAPRGDRIHLPGPSATPERVLAAADIFCLPSLYGEGFPNVVGEAMACGVPCVVTDVGESAEIVGETGLVVAPGDAAALAAALAKMSAAGPQERAARGDSARRRVADRYGLETITARYADLYRLLISE